MRMTAKLRAAAQHALDLADRSTHPAGHFDDAGRWYPDTELPCCQAIRSPSRQWPHSLLVHCRTVKHIAAESNYSPADLRSAMRRIVAEREERAQ